MRRGDLRNEKTQLMCAAADAADEMLMRAERQRKRRLIRNSHALALILTSRLPRASLLHSRPQHLLTITHTQEQ